MYKAISHRDIHEFQATTVHDVARWSLATLMIIADCFHRKLRAGIGMLGDQRAWRKPFIRK
jgi:hypothetical protein